VLDAPGKYYERRGIEQIAPILQDVYKITTTTSVTSNPSAGFSLFRYRIHKRGECASDIYSNKSILWIESKMNRSIGLSFPDDEEPNQAK
jgi:hypothetical protein